jgi:hypothetical protein
MKKLLVSALLIVLGSVLLTSTDASGSDAAAM